METPVGKILEQPTVELHRGWNLDNAAEKGNPLIEYAFLALHRWHAQTAN